MIIEIIFQKDEKNAFMSVQEVPLTGKDQKLIHSPCDHRAS
jgi:hypothetical protein